MTPESRASDEVRLRAAQWGMKLLRNNSGVLPDKYGRPVRFGLGNESVKINKRLKSGDFIGTTPIIITQEMVGKTVGVFTNIEAKAAGFKERETYPEKSREFGQNNFNKLIVEQGGLAGFASCFQDVDNLIKNYIQRLKS